MYMILKSITKNPLRNLAIIFQIVLGTIVLSQALSNYRYFTATKHNAETLIENNVYNLLYVLKSGYKVGNEYTDRTKAIPEDELITVPYNFAKSDSRVEKIGFESCEYSGFKYTENEKKSENILKSKIGTIGATACDKELTEMYKFKVKIGMGFSEYYKSEKNDNFIPILISEELSKDNSVGSIVKLPKGIDSKQKDYKIIGILDSSYPLLDQIYYMGSAERNNNGYFCIVGSLFNNNYAHMYVKLKDGVNKGEMKNDYDKRVGEGKEIQFFGLNDMVETLLFPTAHIIQYIFYGIIILILTSFGVIGTVLASIVKRKQEFGTRIAVGATKTNIQKLVIGELVSLFIFSVTLGLLISRIMTNMSRTKTFIWDFYVIGISVGIVFIMMLISAIPALLRMTKMKPIDLVHGR